SSSITPDATSPDAPVTTIRPLAGMGHLPTGRLVLIERHQYVLEGAQRGQVGTVPQPAERLAVEPVAQQHVGLIEAGIRTDGSGAREAGMEFEDDDAFAFYAQLDIEGAT